MRIIVAIVLMIIASQAVRADLIDNFDRANLANSQNVSNIGSNYVSTGANGVAGAWGINSGRLTVALGGVGSLSSVLSYQNPAYSLSGNFTVSADVKLGATVSTYSGLALNYLDQDTFYALTFEVNIASNGTVRLLKFNDAGVTSTTIASSAGTGNGVILINNSYSLTATSTAAGVFTYALVDGSTTLLSGTFTDSSDPLSGGYAGLYAHVGATTTYDNFTVIPEPTTVGLFLVSAVGLCASRRIFHN